MKWKTFALRENECTRDIRFYFSHLCALLVFPGEPFVRQANIYD